MGRAAGGPRSARGRRAAPLLVLPLFCLLAEGSWQECAGSARELRLTSLLLTPDVPRTSRKVELNATGHLARAVAVSELQIHAKVLYCRRHADCMQVYTEVVPASEVLTCDGGPCGVLMPGQEFAAYRVTRLPTEMIRGSFTVHLNAKVHNETLGCYEMSPVMVIATLEGRRVHDYVDAVMAFLMAAAASYALGINFPAWSRGMMPQITGFLCIGVIVGPYVCNLVTSQHIYLLGQLINKVSLAFIGGAAGAEIFLPEFRALLPQLGIQMFFITGFTVVIVTAGMYVLTSSGLLNLPLISEQPSTMAKVMICVLMSSLSTARSPASAIAIVSELGCSHSVVAKMTLGITVLGDIVVLVLFSLAVQATRIATLGGSLTLASGGQCLAEIVAAFVLGWLSAQLLRLVLASCSEGGASERPPRSPRSAGSTPLSTPRSPSKGSHRDLELHPVAEGAAAQLNGAPPVKSERCLMIRGVLVLAILSASFVVADLVGDWTDDYLHPEPLLVCVVAACVCGHDPVRREALLESLGLWTRAVLLPFFTLAGCSLALPALQRVWQSALCLVLLRLLSILLGSVAAGRLSRRFFPKSLTSTPACVNHLWATLLAQAGVTMGLVLAVQSHHAFKAWSADFSVVVLGDVVMNQIIGPIFCRMSMTMILKEEMELKDSYPGDAGSSGEDSGEDSSWSEAPMSARRNQPHEVDGLYDRLVRRRTGGVTLPLMPPR